MDQPGRYFFIFGTRPAATIGVPPGSRRQAPKRFQEHVRHGTAYTVIRSRNSGIETEIDLFVPLGRCLSNWRLKVTKQDEAANEALRFHLLQFASCWKHAQRPFEPAVLSQFIIKRTWSAGFWRVLAPVLQVDPTHLDQCGRTGWR